MIKPQLPGLEEPVITFMDMQILKENIMNYLSEETSINYFDMMVIYNWVNDEQQKIKHDLPGM